MTDVGDTNDENHGGQDGGHHDDPDGVYKASTGVGNTEKSDGDATSEEWRISTLSSGKHANS